VRSSLSSFNGAAPARARNVTAPATVRAWADLLQRGRARAGAECQRESRLLCLGGEASTGPRPRGRGMMVGICRALLL